MKNLINLLILILLFSACEEKEDAFTPKEYHINGKVEKGPFVSGSKVTLQPLDANLKPLGSSYSGRITDEEGSFDFGSLELASPYAQLTADGYYFNEVEGELSSGQISLSALVELTGNSPVNVNILTHLKYDKVKQLIENDKLSFGEANKKAQSELFACFGLQKYADKDASAYSITAGTNEAGALIVISSSILADRTDAQFTEYMSKLCNEFKTGISGETKTALRESSKKLNLKTIAENIQTHYHSYGKEIHVKDLAYFVDWNDDGIAGNELPEEGGEKILKFEIDTLYVPASGGTFTIKIDANVSFSKEKPDTGLVPDDNISEQNFKLLETSPIRFDYSILQDKQLELTIDPASSAVMDNGSVSIYSIDGSLSPTITIIQDGDLTKPVQLTKDGENFITSICANSREAFNKMYTIEAFYSQCFTPASNNWSPLFEHRLTAEYAYLQKTFSDSYSAIQSLGYVLSNSKGCSTPIIQAASTTIQSMLYYELAVLWGNVPYVYRFHSMDNGAIRQLTEKALFTQLEQGLLSGIQLFNPGKTEQTPANMFIPSADVPRGLLARMYMYNKEYDKAARLFEEIINSETYSLEPDRATALGKGSRELIYAYSQDYYESDFTQQIEKNDFIPVLNYTEVCLSIAECYYRLGNRSRGEEYLNRVAASKGMPEAGQSDFITAMQRLWKETLKGTGSYFAFLKRNGLAEKVLAIENFQLILPIPAQEIATNPNITQNPIYSTK